VPRRLQELWLAITAANSELSHALCRAPTVGRQQTILSLRFYQDMSQAQIGEQLGISQMHVSRLLAKAVATRPADGLSVAAATHRDGLPCQARFARVRGAPMVPLR
jgi:predicted XRE-type DNA-binding protein